jgi:hypothetical protein
MIQIGNADSDGKSGLQLLPPILCWFLLVRFISNQIVASDQSPLLNITRICDVCL